jgi:AhpD family alkylhydroperoxidase
MAASWPHAATDTIFQRIIIMDVNWADTLSSLVKRVGVFAKANPPVASAFHKLETATRETGVLDAKTHELISLAVAVTTRCDGCIAAHAGAARKAGASREEVAAALGTAIALNAGAAYVYSSRALDAYEAL